MHDLGSIFRASVARRLPWARTPATPEAQPAATRTAFVLLGGGARGAAQSGVISVLLEHGIRPDFVAGISAGSWNGAYIALDPTAERAHALEQLWLATTSNEVMGTERWRMAVNAVANRSSLYGSEGMRRVAERYLAQVRFEEMRVPLRVLATDLVSGKPHTFDSGAVLPAVLASSAVPGVFPPTLQEGAVLVDGGPVDWQGCLEALAWGATRICLLGCGTRVKAPPKLTSFRHILERAFEISNQSNFERTAFALRAAGLEVLAIMPELDGGTLLDFGQAPALIAAGRRAAERALAGSAGQHEAPTAEVPRNASRPRTALAEAHW